MRHIVNASAKEIENVIRETLKDQTITVWSDAWMKEEETVTIINFFDPQMQNLNWGYMVIEEGKTTEFSSDLEYKEILKFGYNDLEQYESRKKYFNEQLDLLTARVLNKFGEIGREPGSTRVTKPRRENSAAIWLKYGEAMGMSYKELALESGKEVGTFKTEAYRQRKKKTC